MNRLLNGMHNQTNYALTENGGLARATTNSAVLDFFSQGGALRDSPKRAVPLFDNAWSEDANLALKTMFYFRDIRGGQGQRGAFRTQLKHLANIAPATVRKNLVQIAEYGRWDDLYELIGTELEADVFELMHMQLMTDSEAFIKGDRLSLMAKWLKSENASSKTTKMLATKTRKAFGMSSKVYRQRLSELRGALDVVERKASAGQWDDVNYKSVPSNAMMKYRKAFKVHDGDRFDSFIGAVERGETTMNAGTLYPFEIVNKVMSGQRGSDAKMLNAAWDSLPDYVDGADENAIAVVDVSGSMHGQPMEVAISLGLYLADRSTGEYAKKYITFSESPKLQTVQGTDITGKVQSVKQGGWGYNTNIAKVFDLILDVAVRGNLSQVEMLDKLYIISDMEFDSAHNGDGRTVMQGIQDKFHRAGYEAPQLVFWNVRAASKQVPMSMDDRGFVNVSGFSPSIFQNLIGAEVKSAYDLMLEVIESDRYAALSV